MAKQSGLGDNLYVAGYNLSGDTLAIDTISTQQDTDDQTGIDKSAMERIALHKDGSLEVTSAFNKAAGAEHSVWKLLPSTDVHITYCRGTTLGKPAACMVSKEVEYKGTRDNSGTFKFKVSADANGFGLEWGVQLTAGLRTDTAATNGTGVDTLAATSFGGQAYLQLTAFTGTDVTVKIQDSANNSAFADVASFAFTQVTAAPATQRLQLGSTATLRQYLRAVTVTTGGFTSATFSVVVVKNEIATAF